MSANGTLYVAHCPLTVRSLCRWTSEPQTSENTAREALRTHVNEHPHADLVQFAASHDDDPVTRYVKAEEKAP